MKQEILDEQVQAEPMEYDSDENYLEFIGPDIDEADHTMDDDDEALLDEGEEDEEEMMSSGMMRVMRIAVEGTGSSMASTDPDKREMSVRQWLRETSWRRRRATRSRRRRRTLPLRRQRR